MRPKVLLLDEPLSALDKKLREQMQVELRRLQQAVGITFVLVTHDQYEALGMSDRIAVMFGGRIAQVASPKEIYQRPVNRQVADFLGGMNFVKAEIVEENGASITVDTSGFGRVTTDKPAGLRAQRQGRHARHPAGAAARAVGRREGRNSRSRGKVVDRHYFGEITHLIVDVPGLEKPLSVPRPTISAPTTSRSARRSGSATTPTRWWRWRTEQRHRSAATPSAPRSGPPRSRPRHSPERTATVPTRRTAAARRRRAASASASRASRSSTRSL